MASRHDLKVDQMKSDGRANSIRETRVQHGLVEGEELFRTMADAAPVMIWMAGADKLCWFFNKPWLDFTGRTMQQELGNGWADGVHPDDLDRCLETFYKAFDAREAFSMDYRLRRADGVYRWILDNGVPRYSPDGSFAGYIGSCIDITDRKVMEESLRDSEARYSAFFERYKLAAASARVSVWEWDRETDNLYTEDHTLTEILGFEVFERPSGADWLEILHTDDRDRVVSAWTSLIEGKADTAEMVYRVIDRKGGIWWQHTRCGVSERERGRVCRIIGVTNDITKQKQVEEELRLSEERYRAFFELNAVGAAEVDLLEGRYLRANDAYCQMLGYSRDELLRLHFGDITHPDDREEDWENFTRLVRGEIPDYRLEKRYVRKDGSIIWAQLDATLIRDRAGNPVSEVGLVLDITERKRAEQELSLLAARLLQSQDEERRRIARELHDDTAQTLFVINLNLVDLLQTQVALDDGARSLLTESLEMEEVPTAELTKRELEVLRLMSDGLSTNQIANTVFVSAGTVKLDIRSIYRKLGTHHRAQAIVIAVDRGLI